MGNMKSIESESLFSSNTVGKGNSDKEVVLSRIQSIESSLPQNVCRILICGPIGSGKSSFINTINSIFTGEVGSHWRPAEDMQSRSGKSRFVNSIHSTYKRYLEAVSCWRPAEKTYSFRLCDTCGLERENLGLDILTQLVESSVHSWNKVVDTPGSLFSDSDSKIVADMQKMRVLKQNGLLEEELNWQDTSFIADNLYMGGHLNYLKCKQIQDMSQPRRKAVEILIDTIIGNPSAVSAFIRILESESRFSYIAEKITKRVLTEDHLFPSWETNQILNNKRKCLSFACEYPAAQKRMKINESEAVKEKKMVKSLRIAVVGQKSWNQVSKHLDPEFKEAFKGPFEDEE